MDSTVAVREIVDRSFAGVSETDTVVDTAELMLSEDRDSAVVLRGSEPVGIVTQRDALEALVHDEGDRPVADAMTAAVPTVRPDATVAETARELSARAARRLVVTDGERTLGVLTEHDVVAASSFGPGTDAGVEAAPVDAGSDGPTRGSTDAGAGGFEDQSICEACGSFARDLVTFNGQVLCGDCRDM